MSYFDFFISLLSIYYSFIDLFYTYTQQLSFAHTDLFNCSYSLSYKRNRDEHEGVSAEMARKMIVHAHKYCDVLLNDDPLLEGSINNIKNAKNYEGIDEKEEDEDENDDITIEADDNI